MNMKFKHTNKVIDKNRIMSLVDEILDDLDGGPQQVCLHLGENEDNHFQPFTFQATVMQTRDGEDHYTPLLDALEKSHPRQVQKILEPVAVAAQSNPYIKDLLEANEGFLKSAQWTAAQAAEFLKESDKIKAAGIQVKLPDWWAKKPKTRMLIGERTPPQLGVNTLLNFDVEVTLNGETLTEDEIQQIAESSDRLVMVKGKWTETDPTKMKQVMHYLENYADQGISFNDAMQLMAAFDGRDEQPGNNNDPVPGDQPEVEVGEWMGKMLRNLASPPPIADNAGLQAELRPYQQAGVQWLCDLRSLGLGGCLADDMGLGKTVQVLGALNLARGEPGTDLIVVPASLLGNWEREAKRFAPDLKLLTVHASRTPAAEATAAMLAAHNMVLTTYGMAVRTRLLRDYEWRSVILDEAQEIKNPAAQRTRALKKFKAEWRLVLTGTPIENKLKDLWSLFDFINPGLLGTQAQFRTACRRLERTEEKYKPLRRLIQPYLLRRCKTDKNIVPDLPDKTETKTDCFLTKRQAAMYQQAVDELQEALDNAPEDIFRKSLILKFLGKCKQICNHPSNWLGDGEFAEADSGKFARLRELAEAIAETGEKVLIFTQYRKIVEPLAAFLAGIFGREGLTLHGGTPVDERPELVALFESNPDIPFMVLTVKAGGTGLNLAAASHVIHFDRWWNPAVENQATDRAHRIGQHRNVLVHKFVCQGTLEERIDRMIADKTGLAKDVLDGAAAVKLTEMSDREIMDLVRLDISRAVPDGED